MEKLEQAEIVRRALQQLPDAYREVVVLRHYEGLKFHEIADVLGIPEGTVKSRMFEALDRLAIILKRLGGAPAAHS
jgi:RNA polymerase sigma-70 factor (ECF subfamily)